MLCWANNLSPVRSLDTQTECFLLWCAVDVCMTTYYAEARGCLLAAQAHWLQMQAAASGRALLWWPPC